MAPMPDIQKQQLEANVARQQAETLRILIELGFDDDPAIKAVITNDLSELLDD